MQRVVDIARVVRDRRGVGLKYPLRSLVVICNDGVLLEVRARQSIDQ